MKLKTKKSRTRRPTTRFARLRLAAERTTKRYELHLRRVIALTGTTEQLVALGEMTPPEVAARLRCSLSTAHEWCRSGRLTARRSGRSWLADAASVQALELALKESV